MCEIYSNLTKNSPKRRNLSRSGISIVDFEQVNAGWDDNDLVEKKL